MTPRCQPIFAPSSATTCVQPASRGRDASTTDKVAAWQGALKVLWKQPVGEGHSSPVVAGDRVYLHARVKDTTEEILGAYAVKDGAPLWSKTYDRGNFKSLFGGGP